jgi:flavin-dependent dehydrogenase
MKPTTDRDADYDVAVIGGGPGGSTTGSLLKKYRPDLRVLICEQARFPREHVGESLLPPISGVLHEMGCWDEIERANFPVKIGATFRWGRSPVPWTIQFIPENEFTERARPAPYAGQRRLTSFQVERAVYDQILLRHSAGLGCEVREGTRVTEVLRDGDRVTGLRLAGGERVTAGYYVDASGHCGLLRRALGVKTDCPTRLRNIAIWDYWDLPDWAEIDLIGTSIRILSLGYGWLWAIPIGPTRLSVGLVCLAEYYKSSGLSHEDLYLRSVSAEPTARELVAGAQRTGTTRATSDWSFLSERTAGPNWLLVGEAAGFADPVLAAGLTLTHTGAREAAYTLLELFRGEEDADWLTRSYDQNQRARVQQHIRFADFFYAANGLFSDLQEHCRAIARESGLTLGPEAAWRWLAWGGFTHESIGLPAISGFDLGSARQLTRMMTQGEVPWAINGRNLFHIRLDGAELGSVGVYADGRVTRTPCYLRAGKRLPVTGLYGLVFQVLRQTSALDRFLRELRAVVHARYPEQEARVALRQSLQALEVLVNEGWVEADVDPTRPWLCLSTPASGASTSFRLAGPSAGRPQSSTTPPVGEPRAPAYNSYPTTGPREEVG